MKVVVTYPQTNGHFFYSPEFSGEPKTRIAVDVLSTEKIVGECNSLPIDPDKRVNVHVGPILLTVPRAWVSEDIPF